MIIIALMILIEKKLKIIVLKIIPMKLITMTTQIVVIVIMI